jgi:membrane-associated phospholipid phosphatase
MGDMHYATDVITGALVGSAVGITIPLLRAHRGDNDKAEPKASSVKMTLIPVGAGLGVGGVF